MTIKKYSFIKRLMGVEFSEPQAVAIADGLEKDVDYDHLATKEDLREMESRITHNFMREFTAFQVGLFKWLIPILLGQTALIITVLKLFP